jgi:transposase
MHRDLNAAINILNRATLGLRESNAWGEVSNGSFVEPRNPDLQVGE